MKSERAIKPIGESRHENATRANTISPEARSGPFLGPPPVLEQMPGVHHIELSIQNIDQLFNTMDPSPFHELRQRHSPVLFA